MDKKYILLMMHTEHEHFSVLVEFDDAIREYIVSSQKLFSDNMASISYFHDAKVFGCDNAFDNWLEKSDFHKKYEEDGYAILDEMPDTDGLSRESMLSCQLTISRDDCFWWSITLKYSAPMETALISTKNLAVRALFDRSKTL